MPRGTHKPRNTAAVLVRLVVNPCASGVTRGVLSGVREALAVHHRVQLVATTGRDDATRLAASAVADGVDAVAVLGGDGTLNETLGPLVRTGVTLVPLPGGGTNVFCRSVGQPDDPVAVAGRAAAALADGRRRRVGVGELSMDGSGWRPFLIHTGFGWDAELVRRVESHPVAKRRLGHLMFVAAGAATFLGGYDRRTARLRVDGCGATDGRATCDGTGVATDPGAFFVLVLNTDPYTYVGHRPFVVAPDNVADGHGLVVVELRSMSAPRFLGVMGEALRGRGLRARAWLTVRTAVEDATVVSDGVDLQVDGDHLGGFGTARVRHRPEALWLTAP